jgi:transcription antitermination factor NusG
MGGDREIPEGKRWYAVYTRSRHEKEVAREFTKRDVEHYLPLVRRERRWKDRKVMVDFPLFPGYVFARADLSGEEGWEYKQAIVRIRGVVRILSSKTGAPVHIPDQEIFNIRTVLEKKMKVDPYRGEFRTGQMVRIRKGALAGVEGRLLRRKGVYKLVLQVRLLQQGVQVTLSTADVESLE